VSDARSTVVSRQRFARTRPCPVCGGGEDDQRGNAVRCFGYRMRGGRSVVCTREERAGALPLNDRLNGYAHSLGPGCACGTNHGEAAAAESARNGTAQHSPQRRHGTITRYQIRRVGGELAAVHVREDFAPKDKRFWWELPDGRPSHGELRRDALPLYGIHELASAPANEPVIVTEGEKARDALVAQGFVAVGTVTGDGGTPDDDALRPLPDRRVVLWPDHSDKGLRHMERIATRLGALGHRDLRRLVWPGARNPGDDAADFFDRGGKPEELRALLGAAKAWRESGPMPPAASLVFTSLGDLLAEPDETYSWLVAERLPSSGLSVLVGKPKAGKSTAARCLAVAVARGEPWLEFETKQGPVLYLGLEEKRSEVRRHFRMLGATATDPIHVYIARAPLDGLAQLRKAMLEYRPALVIIDPLFRFTRVPDGNDYATMTAALEPIIELARETQAHLLLVHHGGKGDRTGLDSVLGSTAIAGSVDTVLLLRRTDRHRLLSTEQRYGDALEEFVVAWDSETHQISAGLPRVKADAQDAEPGILAFLADHPSVTEDTVLEAVDGRTAAKRTALRALRDAKKVEREGGGKRGDPYLYSVSQTLSPDISRGRENEKSTAPPSSGNDDEDSRPQKIGVLGNAEGVGAKKESPPDVASKELEF